MENGVVAYIEKNYAAIEDDMNARNSTSRRNNGTASTDALEDLDNGNNSNNSNNSNSKNKTRKKREELSISATKSIKKETVEIVVSFN